MRIRSMQSDDLPSLARLVAGNHARLSAFGESHYGDFRPADLARETPVVFVRGEALLGFCQYRPSPSRPTDAQVLFFVVEPAHHGRGTYIRAQLAMEAYLVGQGFSRVVCGVPPGHARFRYYLIERRGYRPFAEERGVLFLVKPLEGARSWPALIPT